MVLTQKHDPTKEVDVYWNIVQGDYMKSKYRRKWDEKSHKRM
jgi:hypothetical protein